MNIADAVKLCIELEAIAAPHLLHIGLTGGCLYKKGGRKDIDVIVYPENHKHFAGNDHRIIEHHADFVRDMIADGWHKIFENKWLTKLRKDGITLDLFFLERVGGTTMGMPLSSSGDY